MKKLFKLKEWLTIPDAAKHLSIIFDEDVSEADVLRLALDGQLQLSVYFVNQAKARRGKTIPLGKARKAPGLPVNIDGKPCEPYEVILGIKIFTKDPDGHAEEKVLELDDEIVTICGVWDLAMLGGEKLDIEHKYQMLTSGVEVTLVSIDGTYIKDSDGEIWGLQSSFDYNEYQAGSLAQLEKLKTKIADENIERSEAKKLLDQHKENRKIFLDNEKTSPAHENYYPAGGLPEDSILVVRPKALRDLEQRASETTEKNLSTTERNTLLTIIGVMAKEGYGHDLSKPYEAAKEIQKDADKHGIKLSDDTIAGKIKKAKIILEDKQNQSLPT